MKIEIEITDFPEQDRRAIRIMSGIELSAFKYPGEPWMVKTVQCNMCGKCCMNLGDNQPFPVVTTNGVCNHLQREPGIEGGWRCALALQRPFGCSVATPHEKDYCCIEYEAIE